MNWVILIIAGLFETFWAYQLKLSDGFSKLMPSILTIVGMIISFGLLAHALKTLPLALQTMSGGAGVVARAGTVGAATFLTTLPSILVFAIMRGKVMETMSYSGIKS